MSKNILSIVMRKRFKMRPDENHVVNILLLALPVITIEGGSRSGSSKLFPPPPPEREGTEGEEKNGRERKGQTGVMEGWGPFKLEILDSLSITSLQLLLVTFINEHQT